MSKTKYEDGRLHDTGDVIGDLEVTGVSYQEDANGNKINFQYIFRDKKEVDAERKAEADHQAALEKSDG